ncbi:Aminopeptidase N [Camponotus floridanus]|uniref:Aminopeptidase N n=1 Tax=Camponotus floridanus TaxID=104421 RepID=E2B1I0_CAMFO|nr:Aminopeptidase N [Camponotus floridanus]
MQSTMDKSDFKSELKYNVTDKIASWTRLNHYPVINVKRNYDNNWLSISVENLNYFVTWIFVNITTQEYFDSKKLLTSVWLKPNISYHAKIDFIDENYWILANLQQSGCYRVNYDVENWKRLVRYLHTNSFRKIHVLDRAKLIDDAFHFVMTGQLQRDIFFNISHYLSQDTDYIAWYPMFKNLEYISGFFAFPESLFIKV